MPLAVRLSAGLGGAVSEGTAVTDRAGFPRREPACVSQERIGSHLCSTGVQAQTASMPARLLQASCCPATEPRARADDRSEQLLRRPPSLRFVTMEESRRMIRLGGAKLYA